MLFAVLLLGLLPAAFLFDGPKSDDEESGDLGESNDGADSGAGNDLGQTEGGAGDLGEDTAAPESDATIEDEAVDEAAPESLEVPADADDTEISGFRPGTDGLALNVGSQDCGFYGSHDSESGDAVLHIEDLHGERLVTFVGLTDVPLDDISICVTDPLSGEVSEFSLAASESGEGLSLANEGDAIAPVDPEAEDTPVPAEDDDPPAIGPSDPEVEDTPYGGEGDDTALDPVDTLEEELALDRGGVVDDLLARDSDTFGTSGAEAVVPQDGTAGDDTLDAPEAGNGETTYLGGTPQLGGTQGLVDAGAGDDTVLSHGGSYVFGGDGDDSLTDDGTGSALYGGAGNDMLTGGPGGSHLDGGTGDDVILGGDGDDVIEGGEHSGGPGGDDVIDGGAGNDVIRGGAGADRLSGGEGDDVIDHAGRAEERLSAEERHFAWHVDDAVDHLDGGTGDDTLIFGAGDVAHGGLGSDQFHLYSSTGAPAVIDDFASGQDFLRITLDPSQFSALPSYEVSASDNGLDGLVKVDGVVVAVLQGAPSATVDDIYVELLPDLAA